MNIYDKLFTPENLYTEAPDPPNWMNPTMVKLYEYHCNFFLEQDALLKTGIEYLEVFVALEHEMVMQRVKGQPLDLEMCQVYKSYCETMRIDSNVNTRLDWLRAQNWSFEDGKNP